MLYTCDACKKRTAQYSKLGEFFCHRCYRNKFSINSFNNTKRRKYRRIVDKKVKEQNGKCYYCKCDIYKWSSIKPFFIKKRFNYCEVIEDCKFAIIDPISKKYIVCLATGDHVIPMSKGGSNIDPNNIVACCEECNWKKGNK